MSDLIYLVTQASKQIITRERVNLETDLKRDGSLVTEVDEGMQSLLKVQLESRWPHYGFIGEEMSYDDQVRVCEESESGYWVLDPLDGTTNFISGFLFFGVSLALVIDGAPVLAVIYDPVRDECFSAQNGCGAFLNERKLETPATDSLDNCIANIDYKRLVGDLIFSVGSMPALSFSAQFGFFCFRMVLACQRTYTVISSWRTKTMGLCCWIPDFA